MKKILFTLISIVLISCSSSENHADFNNNLEIAKKFINLHSSEDWEAQAELIHEDLNWSQPVYGSENYGKEGHIAAMKMYQSMFDNIKFDQVEDSQNTYQPKDKLDEYIIKGCLLYTSPSPRDS